MNRKTANTAISKSAKEALADLPFPAMASEIAQRVLFAETAATGETVDEREPKGRAAREIVAFVAELERMAA